MEATPLFQGEEHLSFIKVETVDHASLENVIRQTVFIEEQHVDHDIEFDEFEDDSVHYLLFKDHRAIGCGRYRWVGNDIKLERFALLKEERRKGYGSYIMDRLLRIVLPLDPNRVFLHSQTVSRGFYERCGFRTYGEVFVEADIDHIGMYYPLEK